MSVSHAFFLVLAGVGIAGFGELIALLGEFLDGIVHRRPDLPAPSPDDRRSLDTFRRLNANLFPDRRNP